MGRYRKKDITDLIATMMEANEYMQDAACDDTQNLAEMLMQCQDAAVQIGIALESMGKQYGDTVSLLENYCENIYRMSLGISDRKLYRKILGRIRRQLVDLQNKIRYGMPDDKREIVFLPYKASMWDSLESVWRAADADENTDAYVIPIPYFDRNPDGSFGEEHCEGDQYPEYVPVTRYEEYDFEEHRPDMIFIHNAYDDRNYVTSVHPFFYSENLKKFTEKLVYIPYFVLAEIDPKDRKAVEGTAHFCTAPGVFNADRVIVQSENMRQVYINVLTEYMKKNAGRDTREYWENKISGLGSPKFDKVQNTKKEDAAVPEKWRDIIEKKDGSRRKIVLYNTSVTALLQYEEKMLDKIEDVLRLFRKKKDEVSLLWRPHPLYRTTIASMRPELKERYERIVAEYCAQGWGIYDDTADVNRAIALSDAYYGDHSSVVQMYERTGKPVMLQNIDIMREKVQQ